MHVGILTLSNSKAAAMKEGRDEDISGKIIEKKLGEKGYSSKRNVLPDQKREITEKLEEMISDPEIDAIITTGGTGVTSNDITVDTVQNFLDQDIPGFGETFRRAGYERIGSPAILSRSIAGIIRKKPIFSLPGSPEGVELGMKIVLEMLPPLIEQLEDR